MRTSVPIKVKVYYPVTQTGQQKLMRCVAKAHADFVHTKIQKLYCSAEQKRKLTNAIIGTALGHI